jgi:hypothetical protein
MERVLCGSSMRKSGKCRRRVAARLILVEAILYLLAARLALRVFSFSRLTSELERRGKRPELQGSARIRARGRVRDAVCRVARRFPNRTTCLHRAIATQLMLRRRGVRATLYYGAARLPHRGLTTHAWVQDGSEGVIGHVVARREGYLILARYPGRETNARRCSPSSCNAHEPE